MSIQWEPLPDRIATFRDLIDHPEGRRGLVASLAFFALIGGLFLITSSGLLLVELRANLVFVPTSGLVLDKRLVPTRGLHDEHMDRPEVLVRYSVGGRKIETWTLGRLGFSYGSRSVCVGLLDRFQVGTRYTCWYDPSNPERAMLMRGFSWMLIGMWLFSLALTGGCICAIYRCRRLQHGGRSRRSYDPETSPMIRTSHPDRRMRTGAGLPARQSQSQAANMHRRYTRRQRVVGSAIGITLVAGFSPMLWLSLSGLLTELTPWDRYFVAAFSVMMITMGLSSLARLVTRDGLGWIRLSAGLFSFAFAVFGGLLVGVGVIRSEEITGGFPLLPGRVNSAIGSCAFVGSGLVILLLLGKIYRLKCDRD